MGWSKQSGRCSSGLWKVIWFSKELYKAKRKLQKTQLWGFGSKFYAGWFYGKFKVFNSKWRIKALLVSATGTGKTYASAFAVQDFNPKKFLFVVHREQIAKQAINAYKNVFKNTKDFGLLTGNSKDYDSNFLFSTIQTLSKDDVYTKFKKDEFDYIVIDEFHKAGAYSYQKIMDYL